jgi:hypothetical protein
MSDYASTTGMHSRQPSQESMAAASGMNGRLHSQSPALPHPHAHTHGYRERSSEHQYFPGPVLPPPRPSSQASIESDRRSSRTLASVHSILNPTNAEDADNRGRRRSAAQMEEESAYISPPTHDVPLSRPGSSGGVHNDTSPPGFQGARGNGMPRRILTPISPTLHRAASLNRIITTGTIDARGTPFLSGTTVHTAEPGTGGIPPLPPLTGHAGQRQSFSYSQAPTPPMQPATLRRKSVSAYPPGGPNHSAPPAPSTRASPSPSAYSSYSRSGQASPSYPYPPSTGPTPPGSYSLAPSPGSGPLSSVPPVSLDGDNIPHGIPMVSAGQSSYELVSINTGRGMVSLPVEVHVASRQADEKRKRNAGASARFRQRRKEKEREANATIDKLRDQVRFMTQDAEYYKGERDRYLEELKKTMPGWERLLPRSPSPATKRPPMDLSVSGEGMTPSSPQSATSSEQPRPSENDRNTRRRTDAYSLPLPSPTGTQPGHPYQSPFPPYSPSTSGPPSQHPPYSPTMESGPGPQRMSMNDISLGARPNYNSPWSPHHAPASHA